MITCYSKRFESSLENVREGDDQQKMCETTPAIVRDVLYARPSECQWRVRCPFCFLVHAGIVLTQTLNFTVTVVEQVHGRSMGHPRP